MVVMAFVRVAVVVRKNYLFVCLMVLVVFVLIMELNMDVVALLLSTTSTTKTTTITTLNNSTTTTRAAFEDFLTQNSAKIRSNLRNSEQIRSQKSGDNYVLEAPRTGKIAWSSCLQSPARLGCSILLRFHSNPPDSRAYWYKSVTNS